MHTRSLHQDCDSTLSEARSGRHPIGVLMQMVKANQDSRYSCQWLKYDQSSHCRNMSDSSVSYAAGIIHAV